MNQPLLTVIVPCYNVEKYIDKCISSIVSQTYTNLEIILIDDGCTDSTGTICDRWQEKDQRIRVIHKQNEGAACAMNIGVENAKAEYVSFVDPDDWIDLNMYAELMSALLTTDSDIAHCVLCYVYEDGRMEERLLENAATIQTYNRTEGVLMYLQDKWFPSLPTKILKKSLFAHVQLPKGRIFGYDQTVYLFFHQASRTVLLNRAHYFYFQRSDSISRQLDIHTETKKLTDLSDLYYERFSFVEQHPEYQDALSNTKKRAMLFGIYTLRNIIACPNLFPDVYFDVKMKQMRSISLSKDDFIRRKLKYEWYMLKISPKMYKFLRSLYFYMIRVTNRLKITDRKIYFKVSDVWRSNKWAWV